MSGGGDALKNLFLNRHGDAVWLRPHHDRPRRAHIFRNTVVAPGHGIRVAGASADAAVLIVGNAVLAGRTPIEGARHGDNVMDHYDRAGEYLGPRPGRLDGPGLDLAEVSVFLGWNEDVEERRRDGTYHGAYHGPAGRPWPVWGGATPPRAA